MRLVLILAVAAATSVAGASVAMAMQSSQPRSERDQLVCKTEQKTGSRFGRRSCLSRSERERRATNHQREVDDLRGRVIFDCRQSFIPNGSQPQPC